jgi:hypothetical protein
MDLNIILCFPACSSAVEKHGMLKVCGHILCHLAKTLYGKLTLFNSASMFPSL